MNKTLVFDMDGTLANFYNVKGWLEDLNNSNPRPYIVAEPIYNPIILNEILLALKNKGWKIVIVSWLSKNSNKEFDKKVRDAKKNWLEEFEFPYDNIHLVKYGTTKANCTRKIGGYQVLVDDNEMVRKGWHLGDTIDANNDILPVLLSMLNN